MSQEDLYVSKEGKRKPQSTLEKFPIKDLNFCCTESYSTIRDQVNNGSKLAGLASQSSSELLAIRSTVAARHWTRAGREEARCPAPWRGP